MAAAVRIQGEVGRVDLPRTSHRGDQETRSGSREEERAKLTVGRDEGASKIDQRLNRHELCEDGAEILSRRPRGTQRTPSFEVSVASGRDR